MGIQPADFVISPDVTAFDISEFTRADEMAVVGERAANESVWSDLKRCSESSTQKSSLRNAQGRITTTAWLAANLELVRT